MSLIKALEEIRTIGSSRDWGTIFEPLDEERTSVLCYDFEMEHKEKKVMHQAGT